MSEALQPAPGNLASPVDHNEITKSLDAVHVLDPELLERDDTRSLIEMGIQFIGDVTKTYGTPDRPLWNEGSVEARLMTYHNGGQDGHTSAGNLGVGVPRATLLIAEAVNRTASHVVYDPVARAIGFFAASAHDLKQNCGRALLPEGQQGDDYGDERLSAEAARDTLLSAGVEPQLAQTAYDSVMATAFDPNTKTQNIRYEALEADPASSDVQCATLSQELVAAADLLSLTRPRGIVGSVENIVEILGSSVSDRVLQGTLQAKGVSTEGATDIGQVLDIIGGDEELSSRFADLFEGQSKFFSGFQFSDRAIRVATGGQGIDDMFPGRAENASFLENFAERLRTGMMSPRDVWQESRTRAGYQV